MDDWVGQARLDLGRGSMLLLDGTTRWRVEGKMSSVVLFFSSETRSVASILSSLSLSAAARTRWYPTSSKSKLYIWRNIETNR